VQPGQFPGNNAAARINEEDCQNAWTARQAALAPATVTREPIYWNTEATGNYGSFTPTTDIPPKGAVCRWYEQMLVVDGNATKTQAWSCLQHDGSWQMAR
jgi:surface antigen